MLEVIDNEKDMFYVVRKDRSGWVSVVEFCCVILKFGKNWVDK